MKMSSPKSLDHHRQRPRKTRSTMAQPYSIEVVNGPLLSQPVGDPRCLSPPRTLAMTRCSTANRREPLRLVIHDKLPQQNRPSVARSALSSARVYVHPRRQWPRGQVETESDDRSHRADCSYRGVITFGF